MYATGSAASSTDALQQLVTFLVAAGWTTDVSAAEGLGWRAHLHKGTNYVHLRAAENEQPWQAGFPTNAYGIFLYLGTGFTLGDPWNDQVAGAPIANGLAYPIGVGMQLSAGPFSNFFFFSDTAGDNVVVVIEQTSGLFKHIGWGPSLNKAGSYTGGPYFFGSASGYFGQYNAFPGGTAGFSSTSNCPGCNADAGGGCCTFVRADVDSFVGKWVGLFEGLTAPQGYTGKNGDSSVAGPTLTMPQVFPVYAYDSTKPYEFQSLQTSDEDGRANLLPVLLWVLRDGTTTGFSLLGTLPLAFFSNGVGNGYSNASEYLIGADTYKLFPNFAVLKIV